MRNGIRPAILLLSGGLDSATTLAIAKDEGYFVHALSFDYGQRHRFELEAARRVARAGGIGDDRHRVVRIDLRAFGGSALTGDDEVPKHDSTKEIEAGIPVTYVPARNTIFLSFALALAEVTRARGIFIGVNAVDYSGYPDCRPAFIVAFEAMANLATKMGVEGAGREEDRIRIHAPLLRLTKGRIIRRGLDLGVDYALTHSCYDPVDQRGTPCGQCDSCLLRAAGFAEAGVVDPALA